jgi:hypothetical protein
MCLLIADPYRKIICVISDMFLGPSRQWTKLNFDVIYITKAIGNNEERKRNHSTKTQDFNVENPLQQREVKTTGASQQNFTISGVCLQTLWVIL